MFIYSVVFSTDFSFECNKGKRRPIPWNIISYKFNYLIHIISCSHFNTTLLEYHKCCHNTIYLHSAIWFKYITIIFGFNCKRFQIVFEVILQYLLNIEIVVYNLDIYFWVLYHQLNLLSFLFLCHLCMHH